jgi:hypothetical protein
VQKKPQRLKHKIQKKSKNHKKIIKTAEWPKICEKSSTTPKTLNKSPKRHQNLFNLHFEA